MWEVGIYKNKDRDETYIFPLRGNTRKLPKVAHKDTWHYYVYPDFNGYCVRSVVFMPKIYKNYFYAIYRIMLYMK